MSRYSYAGEYKNPAESFFVHEGPNDQFFIYVREVVERDRGPDFPHETERATIFRPHTRHLDGGDKTKPLIMPFADGGEAQDWIDGIHEGFEEDYETYLDENRFEIAQMERYEAFRNEY